MFLIALIGTESVILEILFLECINLDINWKSKTLAPHNVPGLRSSLNPIVTDVSDHFPNSGDSPTSDDKKNTPWNKPVSFMISPKSPPMNQNVKVHLVNQLYIDPEDQVYLFHIYSNLINTGGLPDIYHDLTDVFAETSLD